MRISYQTRIYSNIEICRLFSSFLVVNMYNQASIQKILDSDNKILVTVLEIVTMARKTLTDLRKIFICSRKTLIADHRTLLDIRKMLKIIHKVSDIPSVIMEALKDT